MGAACNAREPQATPLQRPAKRGLWTLISRRLHGCELQAPAGDRAAVSVDPGRPLYGPAPNRFHQEISRNLQFELHSYLKRNPIGKLFDALFDVYLDEINVFQPDIIIVLNERLGILTEEGAEGALELVVENLSPKTRRLDLVNKKQEYARAGVRQEHLSCQFSRRKHRSRWAVCTHMTLLSLSSAAALSIR
jgi:hypothetical protein